MDTINSAGKLLIPCIRYFINKLNCIIVVNQKCKLLAMSLMKNQKKIYLIGNFIPPGRIEDINNPQILQFREKYQNIIVSTAWKIKFYKGIDLYGIDLLIELMNKVIKKINVGLIFLLPIIQDELYFGKLNEKINEYGLNSNILFIHENIDGPSLWNVADLVIRATSTDIVSMMMYEALMCGTPVLASDSVERAPEVTLFKNRDVDDLVAKTLEILNNKEKYSEKLRNIKIPNSASAYLEFYKKLQLNQNNY
jgi:glycosyltransferase involved in cell wall biosynthesis